MASSSDSNRSTKPKGRYVPSRYKQSAEKYSSHCSDETSSGPDKFYLSRNPRLFSTIDKTKGNQTTCKKKTHSTPEIPGTAPPNFDASAITDASCTFRACPKRDRLNPKAQNNSGSKAMNKSNAPKITSNIISSRGTGRKNENVDKYVEDLEAEMDIAYAEYQLNLLLENNSRKSLQDKSKVALEKIYGVFCYIQMLLGKHESLKRSLNVVSFLLEMNEHLEKQEKMLVPALKALDVLEKKYEEIAMAVDCVQHKLPIEEVLSIEGAEEKIIQLLNNIDNYLTLILVSVGNVDELVNTSDAANSFVQKGKLTSEEMKRCSELLNETRSLMLSEATLKFALDD